MKLRPLGNRVVLQYQKSDEKTQSGIILPENAKEKPQEARVVAVGDGTDPDGSRTEMLVKEGDHVIFSKYSGTEVKLDKEEYVIVQQKDILAIVE